MDYESFKDKFTQYQANIDTPLDLEMCYNLYRDFSNEYYSDAGLCLCYGDVVTDKFVKISALVSKFREVINKTDYISILKKMYGDLSTCDFEYCKTTPLSKGFFGIGAKYHTIGSYYDHVKSVIKAVEYGMRNLGPAIEFLNNLNINDIIEVKYKKFNNDLLIYIHVGYFIVNEHESLFTESSLNSFRNKLNSLQNTHAVNIVLTQNLLTSLSMQLGIKQSVDSINFLLGVVKSYAECVYGYVKTTQGIGFDSDIRLVDDSRVIGKKDQLDGVDSILTAIKGVE